MGSRARAWDIETIKQFFPNHLQRIKAYTQANGNARPFRSAMCQWAGLTLLAQHWASNCRGGTRGIRQGRQGRATTKCFKLDRLKCQLLWLDYLYYAVGRASWVAVAPTGWPEADYVSFELELRLVLKLGENYVSFELELRLVLKLGENILLTCVSMHFKTSYGTFEIWSLNKKRPTSSTLLALAMPNHFVGLWLSCSGLVCWAITKNF